MNNHEMPSVDELIRQLEKAIARGWTLDESWFNELRGVVDKLVTFPAWHAIPPLLPLLTNRRLDVRALAGKALMQLGTQVPPHQLPSLELRVRSRTCQDFAWHEYAPIVPENRPWTNAVWAMYTMHSSGYRRESAVRRLALAADPSPWLPYLLLRLNDWVHEVRESAASAVRRLLSPEYVDAWAKILGLITLLSQRTRVTNAWVIAALPAVFAEQRGQELLAQAILSPDRLTARTAFAIARQSSTGQDAGLIWHALKSHDLVLRKHAAVHAANFSDASERAKLLDAMWRDRYMPVRRLALYAELKSPAHVRGPRLMQSLMDTNGSMRHAARVYLRDDREVAPTGFDARLFYLTEINQATVRALSIAIAGLGETGTAEDATLLKTFLSHTQSGVPKAATLALQQLEKRHNVLASAAMNALRQPPAS